MPNLLKKYIKSESGIIITSVITIGFMLLLNMRIFENYHKNLLSLQEDNITTTVKVVANGLKNYYDECLLHFSLYFSREVRMEDLMAFCDKQDGISGAAVTDEKGQVILSYGNVHDSYYIEMADSFEGQASRLYPPVLVEERRFTQFMIKELPESFAGKQYVIATIDTEQIYKHIVEPVKIGESGYSMVKDFDGTILMHKSRDQIGIDAIEGRKQQYSEYNLKLNHLESWVEQQRVEQEGSGILNSYWWEDGKEPVETRKVVAYTQVPIGDEIWIINCTLDYDEIQNPLNKMRNQVSLLTIGVTMIFGILLLQVVNNINRRRTMEQEMKHLQQMNEAWEELHKREEQIRHNDKMKTLGTMTSMIAHEFNNFLTPIMLYGEMLAQDACDHEEKTALLEIVEAATKAKDLTSELSQYGRTENYHGKKTVIQVSKEIERSLRMIRKTLPDNIGLEHLLESDEGYGLLGSSGLINQIVVNLCTNAIHAMAVTGGVLTVKGTLIRDQEAVHYGITIADTGHGMSETTLSRIFTPFYTTKDSGMGTGLGLSVVQDMVHQVSGEISAISVEGQGSRFDILLPLFKRKEEADQASDTISLSKNRIYILDDNERAGKALEKSLKRECKKVCLCLSPEKALSELKQSMHQWDIIITDYSMPMMNGLEFAGILRSLGYSGTIILVSGHLEQETEWYLENEIIQGALEKPVTLQDIQNCINLNRF
jgi:signal transduction histidine kinase